MEQTEATTLTPAFFMCFPLLAALAVIYFVSIRTYRRRQKGTMLSVGTYVLAGLIVGVQIFLSVWCAMGNIDATTPVWLQCSITLGLVGSLLPYRDTLHEGISSLELKHLPQGVLPAVLRFVRDAAAILLAAELARNALEVPWNDLIRELTSQSILVEYAVIALAMATTFFIGQRTVVGPAIIAVASAFIGIAQDFVIRFKGTAILPMDVLAMGTAAEVANQYALTLTDNDLLGITYAAWALFFLAFVRPVFAKNKLRLVVCTTANIMLALGFGLALDWWAEVPEYREEFGYDIFYWWSSDSYREQGFFPSFLTAAEDLVVTIPANYSAERALATQDTLAAKADALPERSVRRTASTAQFDKTQPSVIVVMNETFSDLSIFEDLNCGYTGPKFFNSMNDTLSRGKLYVSVYGGSTCNSEFEFLTGNSLSYLGLGKYPYQMYSFNNVANLAQQFNDLGYHTTAMHPNHATNWNRDLVYSQMGFDDFVDLSDFDENAPRLHMGITDRTTYDKVLEILESSEEPQFIFDVTMQNHGGYSADDIPAERMTTYAPEGFGDGTLHELNVYLSCIQASDDDLAYFVGKLKKIKRPVVLVFFGDHQPGFTNKFNDAFYPDESEDDLVHQERLYETAYIVWANYNVAGVAQNSPIKNTSADFLGTLSLDLIGVPLTDFQKAQIATNQRIPIVNALGYQGTDGRWHEPETFPSLDTSYRDMAMVDYLNFGSKV